MSIKTCTKCSLEVDPGDKHAFITKRTNREKQGWCQDCVRLEQYGIGRATYELLYSRQNGECAVCSDKGKPYPSNHTDMLGILYDNGREKVLALACGDCKNTIAGSKWNANRLALAATYLANLDNQ